MEQQTYTSKEKFEASAKLRRVAYYLQVVQPRAIWDRSWTIPYELITDLEYDVNQEAQKLSMQGR